MIEITPIASGSSGNCYYVTDGTTPLLLDCGVSWRRAQQALGYTTSQIAGCLLTHEHNDHAKALRDVIRAGIDVYASHGTIDMLGTSGHRLRLVAARQQVSIGTWQVLPFETEHDAAEPLGFLLASGEDKLLYATDTFYVRYRFRGLTHIMIECNYALDLLRANVESGAVPPVLKNRLLKSHFSLEHVKEFLAANDLSRVQEIWLLHLSRGNSDETQFKAAIQRATGKPVYVAR
ncbi:MAG: MBL fold metallo-hydrolase [Pigmentiphaga sp.]